MTSRIDRLFDRVCDRDLVGNLLAGLFVTVFSLLSILVIGAFGWLVK